MGARPSTTLSAPVQLMQYEARIRATGGLSNRLFQFACLLGYCTRSGGTHVPVVYAHDIDPNPHTPNDASFIAFPQVRRVQGRRTRAAIPEKNFKEKSMFAYTLIPRVTHADVCIHGYRQSASYFGELCVPALEAARIAFRYRTPQQAFPMVFFPNAAFIHVRRGDFVGSPLDSDLRLYFNTCLNKLLSTDAASTTDSLNTRPLSTISHIVLISNDQTWASELVRRTIGSMASMPTLVLEPDMAPLTDVEAIMTMAACAAGGICSNSTLSWWGAYTCFLQTGARSFFPYPWMTSKTTRKYKADYPPWARLLNVFTGDDVPVHMLP